MKCYWWNRWWHKRLREYDRRFMLSAIVRAAVRYEGDPYSPFVESAWQRFKGEPGQEHWHCECAKQETETGARG